MVCIIGNLWVVFIMGKSELLSTFTLDAQLNPISVLYTYIYTDTYIYILYIYRYIYIGIYRYITLQSYVFSHILKPYIQLHLQDNPSTKDEILETTVYN